MLFVTLKERFLSGKTQIDSMLCFGDVSQVNFMLIFIFEVRKWLATNMLFEQFSGKTERYRRRTYLLAVSKNLCAQLIKQTNSIEDSVHLLIFDLNHGS